MFYVLELHSVKSEVLDSKPSFPEQHSPVIEMGIDSRHIKVDEFAGLVARVCDDWGYEHERLRERERERGVKFDCGVVSSSSTAFVQFYSEMNPKILFSFFFFYIYINFIY